MVEMVKATLNGKFEIILPKHRADRPEWYTEKGWEKKRLYALWNEINYQKNHMSIQPVVYYVGAEEGEMPALCQIWGAEVVLFEPNPKVWPNMKAIWEANKLKPPMGTFEGFCSNVTSKDAYANLYSRRFPKVADGEVIGNHGFKELYLEADNYPQIRISEAVGVGDLALPTIITFDCEGSDWEVMKGAESLLAHEETRPTIFASIHPEFMFHQFGQYQREFRDWIIQFGYDENILDYQHELHTVYYPKGKR